MNLNKKKALASRALNIGRNRIIFNKERISDIKEAITKQDIKDLLKDKAIMIKEVAGRRKIVKRKTRRRAGSRKKIVKNRKADYVLLIRKLRAYVFSLRRSNKIARDSYLVLRKEIRSGSIKSLSQIKDRAGEFIK